MSLNMKNRNEIDAGKTSEERKNVKRVDLYNTKSKRSYKHPDD